jgi:two-component system, NarL family, sensor histidine kinase LiaS
MSDNEEMLTRKRKNIRVFLRWLRPHGLQADMTISYVWVTVAAVLVLETLALALNGINPGIGPWQFTGRLASSVLVSLLIAAPIGGLFGLITTRGLVRRLHSLALATTRFADGDYVQRVPVARADEVGQLEQQFNRMAEQLVASIAQQQALAEQNARIQERARISRELHDAISQNLFSLRTLIDGLQAAIQAGAGAADLQPHVAVLEQTTNTMTHEMRALLLEMRPPQLEGLQLAEALQSLADAYTSRLGIAVTTSIVPVVLSATTEQTLLRIAQEALSNAARHANATLMTLSLASQERAVCLTITDNGQGMSPGESGKSHGLGLRLMQERVQELRGSFLLDTALGQGTRVQICVPQEEGHDTRPHS